MEQNREPRRDVHKYSQLIFDKRAKAIYTEQSFQQMELEQLDISKIMNLDIDLRPNGKFKTGKLEKKQEKKNLCDLGFGDRGYKYQKA